MVSKKWSPPPELKNLDQRSASNMVALKKEIQENKVTLALGSGVSASAGLPAWPEFLRILCESFFWHWESRIETGSRTASLVPKNLSICGAVDEYLNCSGPIKEIADLLATKDPLLVAQQIKNCIRPADWRYLCIKALNSNDDYETNTKSKIIGNLVKLCIKNKNLKTVINYNYDNLFEIYLNRKKVKHTVIWEPRNRRYPTRIAIYHPHGCLPIKGGPSSDFVLAESDYYEEATKQYSWANLIQSQLFGTSLCVFVGLSMTDPNIRRLLRASLKVSTFTHYAFLPTSHHPKQAEIMLNAIFDNDLYKLGVKVIRYPKTYYKKNPYSRLTSLIGTLTSK